MRKTLERAASFGEMIEIMYIAKDGSISQRRVKVLLVGELSFSAYCYFRKSKRTFRIENVLAAVPVILKEMNVV